MADYIASSRTNFFRVKDESLFRHWAENLELRVEERIINDRKYFTFRAETDHGDWPWYEETENNTENMHAFAAEIAQHLQEDSVAVLLQCGMEKLRYLRGWAVAVNSNGETVEVSIDDIYSRAEDLGSEIAEALY